MLFRALADTHYLNYVVSDRRASDIGLGVTHHCLTTLRQGTDFALHLGDMIQVDADLGALGNGLQYDDGAGAYHQDAFLLHQIAKEFHQCSVPGHLVFGNHDLDRTGGLQGAAQITRTPSHSYATDIDGHKLIIIQQEFKDDPAARQLKPHSDENLEFLADTLSEAKRNGMLSVTAAMHAPVDDLPDQQRRALDNGYDIRNTYRDRSDEFRHICYTVGAHMPIMICAGHSHLQDIHAKDNVIYATLPSPVQRDENGTPDYGFADIERSNNGLSTISMYGKNSGIWNFAFDHQSGHFKEEHRAPQPLHLTHSDSELPPALEA